MPAQTGNPTFRRHYRVETVPGEGVFLLAEHRQVLLADPLVVAMAPYLDGKHAVADLLAALEAEHPPERVLYALDQLVAKGHAGWTDGRGDPAAAGLAEALGGDGDTAARELAAARLRLVAVGEADATGLAAALAGNGLAVTGADRPDLVVVVTDDHLHTDLAGLNRQLLAAGTPWLLARPRGLAPWIGPLFRPGRTGCWACLAQRVRGHRQTEQHVREALGGPAAPRPPAVDLPALRAAAEQLTAYLAALAVTGLPAGLTGPAGAAGAAGDGTDCAVLTLSPTDLRTERHPLTRRPQCPECGDPSLLDRRSGPVALVPRPARYTADGGHRAEPPEVVLERYGRHVSPVTGVVASLTRVPTADGLHTYYAGHNFALGGSSLLALRTGLRSQSAGKGATDVQARASGLCEGIERYSGLWQGDEPRVAATAAELGDEAVPPPATTLFSDRQYADRAALNADAAGTFRTVAEPFEPDRPIDWTPLWSLSGRRRLLPTMQLYFGYPTPRRQLYAWADSNGNAAGSSLEDAILQGFLELVERDSVALWWYNRLSRPAVDLDSFAEPYVEQWLDRYRAHHREAWVLDVTADFGIPAMVAVSRRTDKPVEDVLLSFGAHLDPRIALLRALTEMNQFLPAVVDVDAAGAGYAYPDPEQLRWWRTETVARQPYLRPAADLPPSRASDFAPLATGDLAADVRLADRLVTEHGLELLVLDQTRPDIGLPVVKVVVPGMRHFWTRFAPGRLYDVPVELGWLDRPTAEADLNPIAMFL